MHVVDPDALTRVEGLRPARAQRPQHLSEARVLE